MDGSRHDYYHPPINFFSEDFIAGYQPSRRMSVVRRFFCLFVTFDLIFISLLWLICIVINGENIYKVLEKQIFDYTIEKSLFDVVVAACGRFLILIFFYGILQVNHWIIIAFTTTFSCGFLITKVFYYEWPSNQLTPQQPVFQVLLIIISFVISWFEAWFLDSRMIPQEEYSRTLTQALNSSSIRESTPLLAPFLHSIYQTGLQRPPESYRQSFYSPVNSDGDNSDEEDDEFKRLGIETVIKAYELLESPGWKVERTTASSDVIYTSSKPIGKIYKLRAKVEYPPEKLLKELFYGIEEFPTWNPTLLESRIIKKIDDNTDISYSVSTSGGGGIVKSRDFVNLRCWKLINNSNVIENFKLNSQSPSSQSNVQNGNSENVVNECERVQLKKSSSDVVLNGLRRNSQENENGNVEVRQLSKSLEASNINSDDDDQFSDAQVEIQNEIDRLKDVFVSAAISIDYPKLPPTDKYIRGDNLVSCWAMRPVEGEENSSIFEWLLCIDLKGSLHKYILNTAFVTLMTDYMTHLRNRVEELNNLENESEEESQNC
ncbi:CLUMA_CG016235, isoform A [Clunio marinus]|uniref:CLUMA_CG016235, isoform A n=1 Tax=Clunio marinus TaxID=568069 RepID=A0A1J1ISE7_9DIPT|nr:CLUMA_CG016235, isoform A [Clunio marinus]